MPNTDAKGLGLLKTKLEEAKLRNPNWSLRAFAQKVGISSGALSEILAGKRPLSLKARKRMIERLQLSPREQLELLEDVSIVRKSNGDHHQLGTDAFHLISDWWHFAILNLVKTVGFKPETAWIATRLGIPQTVAKEAWLRLFRLGYLQKTSKGKVVRKISKFKTSEDVLDLSLRRSHMEDTKLVAKALLDVPIEEREVNSVTLAIPSKEMARAKDLIRKFQDDFCDLIEGEPSDDVYRLTIAFFPLTARGNTK